MEGQKHTDPAPDAHHCWSVPDPNSMRSVDPDPGIPQMGFQKGTNEHSSCWSFEASLGASSSVLEVFWYKICFNCEFVSIFYVKGIKHGPGSRSRCSKARMLIQFLKNLRSWTLITPVPSSYHLGFPSSPYLANSLTVRAFLSRRGIQ